MDNLSGVDERMASEGASPRWHYRRLGLGDLLRRPEFGGGQEEPSQLPQSPQKAPPCDGALAADPPDDCPPDVVVITEQAPLGAAQQGRSAPEFKPPGDGMRVTRGQISC
jgi:hypothetical protein